MVSHNGGPRLIPPFSSGSPTMALTTSPGHITKARAHWFLSPFVFLILFAAGTHRSFIGPCIGDCGSTDPTQVEWTEIGPEYTGQQTWDGNSWPVRQLANGQPWWDKVPSAPNGDYLIRNEVRSFLFLRITRCKLALYLHRPPT